MTNRPSKTPVSHRKSESARRANQIIRGRTLLMMLVLGVGTFLLLFWKLYDLQINRYDEMTARAVHQQTREVSINASRGTIYDKNHNILASSTTAETVFLDPLRIAAFVKAQEKAQDEAAAKALEKGKSYTRQPILDQSYIARGLARILEIDQEKIEKMMEKTSSEYEILRRKTEKEMADEVRKFINGQIDAEGSEVPETEQRSITELRAAEKSFTQGKSNKISAYRSATARLPSVAPVSAITTSQGRASRRGWRDFKHRSRQRISFLKIIPIDSRGFVISSLSF